jgi:hypothetical protein
MHNKFQQRSTRNTDNAIKYALIRLKHRSNNTDSRVQGPQSIGLFVFCQLTKAPEADGRIITLKFALIGPMGSCDSRRDLDEGSRLHNLLRVHQPVLATKRTQHHNNSFV